MRVLFWSEAFEPSVGGVEVLAAHLLPALRERGHEFVVIARDDSGALPAEERWAGLTVYRFPLFAALSESDLNQIKRIVQRLKNIKKVFKPDLVHVFYGNIDALFHQLTSRTCPAPVLVTLHVLIRPQFLRPGTVLGSILPSAAWVAACSQLALAGIRKEYPQLLSRSSVVPNSLPAPQLVPEPPRTQEVRLLCLGRLVREKGFDLALEAFALLAERFPNARLIIAGDGPERTRLEAQAHSLGVANAVNFVGLVRPEAVPELIRNCTLVVMPTRLEAFGLVALQAAQMARPVVATRVGGLVDLVVDGETGILVEPEASQALAEAIAMLLRRPDKLRQMGEAARRRSGEVFSWERFVDAYDALYRRIAGTAQTAV